MSISSCINLFLKESDLREENSVDSAAILEYKNVSKFLKSKRVLNRAIKYNYKFNHYIHSIKSGGAISRAQ